MRVSAGWATRLALPAFFTGMSIFYWYVCRYSLFVGTIMKS